MKMESDVLNASSFLENLHKGKKLTSNSPFLGLRLKNHSSAEMICDCCSDDGCGQDDCCGFN